MTRYSFIHLLFFIFIFSANCVAQVSEIGLYFKKSGLIQEINYQQKELIVNFPSNEGIFEEIVLLTDPKTKLFTKGISDMKALRIGMEIEITGDKMPKQNLIVSNILSIKDFPKKMIVEKGRLDDISQDFAVIDGNKVKMKSDAKIIGDKKTLYKGKTFANFRELKLGDFISVDGSYDNQGYIMASEVRVSPDLDTGLDREKRGDGKVTFHNKFYDDWIDPVKRNYFLGGECLGDKIANSASLQTYVQNLGSRLVPDFAKEKFKFMFVAVVNKDWNAGAYPDGLVVINTGLLDNIDNEAQLAAIVGHEITHTIYEHAANKTANKSTREDNGKVNTDLIKGAGNLSKLFTDWSKVPNVKISPTMKRNIKLNIDSLSKAFNSYEQAKKVSNLSKFSMECEAQSDRVGLYILSKNGYDPREAMKVWRNKFNESPGGPEAKNQILATSTQVNTFSKTFNRYRKPPSASDIGVYVFKNAIKNKTNSLYSESVYASGKLKSHPDRLKRFGLLNQYVSFYYSNPESVGKLLIRQAEYKKILEVSNAEMSEAERLLEEKIIKNYVNRYNLDKAHEKAMNKIKSQLSSKQTTLLNYKEFKINSSLKVLDLVGKTKCNFTQLKGPLSDVYEAYNSKITTFTNSFKAGNISPNKRNELFAVNYVTQKNYNDFAVDVAARIQICDTETLTGIASIFSDGTINKYLAPDYGEMSDIYNYLESLNKKDSK